MQTLCGLSSSLDSVFLRAESFKLMKFSCISSFIDYTFNISKKSLPYSRLPRFFSLCYLLGFLLFCVPCFGL